MPKPKPKPKPKPTCCMGLGYVHMQGKPHDRRAELPESNVHPGGTQNFIPVQTQTSESNPLARYKFQRQDAHVTL
jgi:hypothetical protein